MVVRGSEPVAGRRAVGLNFVSGTIGEADNWTTSESYTLSRLHISYESQPLDSL